MATVMVSRNRGSVNMMNGNPGSKRYKTERVMTGESELMNPYFSKCTNYKLFKK